MAKRHVAWVLSVVVLLAGCLPAGPDNDVAGPDARPRMGPGPDSLVLNQDLGFLQIFPDDNWWHLDISEAPRDVNEEPFIWWIGCQTEVHPDFGPSPYGLPYMVVSDSQSTIPITWTASGSQSDDGAPGQPPGYPIPIEARFLPDHIEGGTAGGGTGSDHHMIIIDRDNGFLYETWRTYYNPVEARWEAGSGAVFDLTSNDRRPPGWTSADAAGLAILPGLIKYDEVYGPDEIDHAFRVTFTNSSGFVWPASHIAGTEPGAMPLGTRLRLRAGFDESGYAVPMQKILRAMKKYGLIFADNGSDLYIQGTMDPRWDSSMLNPAFHSINAEDFEIIRRGWRPSMLPADARRHTPEISPQPADPR